MGELKCEVLPENFDQYDLSFKLIVIGDSGVGKSCLTMRATKEYFEEFYSPTVGFEFFTFNIKINNKCIKLQIWDTCGQEVYRSLISSFYRNSSLAIMVYSVDNENSFSNLENWLNEIKTQSNPDVKIFLIGNKTDLEDKRVIEYGQGELFKKDNKLDFFIESSAKTGLNAKNVFIQAAKLLYTEHLKYKDRTTRPGSLTEFLPSEPKNQMLDDENSNIRQKNNCC